MSQKFNRTDYLTAAAAAKDIGSTVDQVEHALVFDKVTISLLVYFFAHISEHRRGIPVSSEFYYNTLRQAIYSHCKMFGENREVVTDSLARHAKRRAKELWAPRVEGELYKTANVVTQEMVDFLKQQK